MSIKSRALAIMGMAFAGSSASAISESRAMAQAMNDHFAESKRFLVNHGGMVSGNGRNRKRKSNMNHVSRIKRRANRRAKQGKNS